MKTEITDRFTVANEAGEEFAAVKITSFTRFQPLKGGEQWLPGSYRYELADGSGLEEIETGKLYKVWDKEERLRRLT